MARATLSAIDIPAPRDPGDDVASSHQLDGHDILGNALTADGPVESVPAGDEAQPDLPVVTGLEGVTGFTDEPLDERAFDLPVVDALDGRDGADAPLGHLALAGDAPGELAG
ncbi:MAG TPA: hypothetical protein VMT43_11280, partial [Acidimicrobiales bacterium]|nr:hypothetical protein [Acidimicrobiales bacterium]